MKHDNYPEHIPIARTLYGTRDPFKAYNEAITRRANMYKYIYLVDIMASNNESLFRSMTTLCMLHSHFNSNFHQ